MFLDTSSAAIIALASFWTGKPVNIKSDYEKLDFPINCTISDIGFNFPSDYRANTMFLTSRSRRSRSVRSIETFAFGNDGVYRVLFSNVSTFCTIRLPRPVVEFPIVVVFSCRTPWKTFEIRNYYDCKNRRTMRRRRSANDTFAINLHVRFTHCIQRPIFPHRPLNIYIYLYAYTIRNATQNGCTKFAFSLPSLTSHRLHLFE